MPSHSCPLIFPPPTLYESTEAMIVELDLLWLLLAAILLLGALLLGQLARLSKRLAQRQRELNMFNELALAAQGQDETAILREAMRLFAQVAHCLQACLYLTQNSLDPVITLRYPRRDQPCELFTPKLVQQVIESQRVQIVSPLVGRKSGQIIGIPLSAGKKTIGVLCAVIPRSRFSPSPPASWFSSFGATVGLLIENTRLYQSAQQDLACLVALRELQRGISSALDLQQLQELLLEKICDFLGLEAADLYLTATPGGPLALSASQWPKEWGTSNMSQTHRAELAERAMHAGRITLFPSPQLDLPFALLPFVSSVGIPLTVGKQAIGVLSLYSGRTLHYDVEELGFLSTVGSLAAVAIDNARLMRSARAAEAEAKNQALYRECIMESLSEGVLVFDRAGRISEVNQSLCQMTGFSRQELLNTRLVLPFCSFQEVGHFHDLVVRCQNGAAIGPVELLLQHKDGRGLPAQVAMAPFLLDHHTVGGCVVSVRDISADKEKLAELVQTSKLASIGRLAAGVAHELNTPLTAILGHAQYLKNAAYAPDIAPQLGIIETQAQRAARIVRSLLSFARHRPQERTTTDLNDTVRSAAELIGYQLPTDKITLIQKLDPALPWIEANPGQLQQVILNILVNAQQAIKSCRERGLITVETSAHDRVVRFSCTDDGPGIAPQILDHIFKPFVTSKRDGEGTGLGLSICYQIISEHNGRIWAETEPGKGSTFFFELLRSDINQRG